MRPDDFSAPRFPIRIAARRAGVSLAALRAWERRYGAITPARTDGEQRLYSEHEIERIALLRELTDAGHSISAIATATTDELRRLRAATIESGDLVAPDLPPQLDRPPVDPAELQRLMADCMRAVRAHDAEAVYRLLQREAFRRTTLAFLEEVATPLMRRIGDDWAGGTISEAQERVASGALRRVLGVLLQYLRIDDRDRSSSADSPLRILAATLAGERHENGALMAAAIAADVGCDVAYPGADLPASALAAAARQARANIVGLSVIDGSAPRVVQRELSALRDTLPARTRIVVGGASAALLDDVLKPLGARRVDSLGEWRELLVERVASSGRGARQR